jgi:hypothetical protein
MLESYHSACHSLARWFAEPISSTLKMEAISYSETSGETQRTTRRHIPEDDILYNRSVIKHLNEYVLSTSPFGIKFTASSSARVSFRGSRSVPPPGGGG